MKYVLAAICLASVGWGAELPAGAKIEIRLKTKVSSNASKPHDPIEAIVIRPLAAQDECLLPMGAVVRGEVVSAAPSAAADQRATLKLDFNQLAVSAGKTIPLATKLIAVDNARETVDENGLIQGILASESLSSRMDQGINKLSARASGLADLLQVAKSALIKTTDSEIVYEPGVEITLELAAKAEVDPTAIPGVKVNHRPLAPDARLERMAQAQPFQTFAAKPPKESDLINLMFIGSRDQLVAAFTAAGWSQAVAVTKISGFETFAAIAEQRGYKEAPMSTLLLEGHPADFNYQKQNNTFAQRHHLRIWRRPVEWQGQEVWVASATHDIGIDFSPENRTFIHKVDSQVDDEKMKVVWDLMHAGAVRNWRLVDRAAVPRQCMNATGDKLVTDGKLAVLTLATIPSANGR